MHRQTERVTVAIQQASNSVAVGADLLQRARRSSDAATAWILSKVAEDGEPVVDAAGNRIV